MNPYESGDRKNIPAVLLYVFSRFSDGEERVLMIHRDAKDRPGDFHAGKWNGLGGKCEKDESYRETASRELFEESTLRIAPEDFRFLGFLQFPNFKPKKSEDWSCMLFHAEVPEPVARRVPKSVAEGSLHWVKASELAGLNLWSGDRDFIGLVAAKKPFTGCSWYVEGEIARSEITAL
jgi:8-oxo-dGTP diphosphatase